MLLFRSEEHVDAWLAARGDTPGATITSDTMCELAHAWWGDRLDPDWRPRTRDESQAILAQVGLTDPYWQLG